jgi:hypothetical protein
MSADDFRYGLGMDDSHDWDSVCGVQYGRAVQFNAHQRRTLLCFGSSGATGLGTVCCVDYRLE